jgi:hypothetical protein
VRDASDHIEGAFAVGNLIGIPSAHYDPHFTQVVGRALATFQPSVVALELPDGLSSELEWASTCWPGPVVAKSVDAFFPFVPGDSIFEAFRLAVAAGIPVALIDLPAAGPPPTPPRFRVGTELVRAGTKPFLETFDALVPAGRPQTWHDAREAHMAQRLSRLLAQGETVLWVGGLAHCTRIVRRVKESFFDGPSIDLTTYSSFQRMRLAPSALYRLTCRLPWLVHRYAQDPSGYDEHSAIQILCLEAGRSPSTEATTLILSERPNDTLDLLDETETTNPIDVARTLQYARNLAATRSLRERPSFDELLTAAAASIGPKYAGSVYELAMSERASPQSLNHDPLEWEVSHGYERYRCGDEIFAARPWSATPLDELPLNLMEIRRRARGELYKDLPAAGNKRAKTRWECDPDDEDAYIAFVEYVLRRASVSDPEEPKSVPFQAGMRDGLDVRATLRKWTEDTVYVREEGRAHQNFTNAAIDWINASERSDLLTGKEEGGWTEPSFLQIGSVSRTTKWDEVQKDPWIQRDYRKFSLISLDGGGIRSSEVFYDSVIYPLVELGEARNRKDNLYEWLEIMFRFCAGKPFAYYSMYVPSPEIHRIAWRHKVHVVHFPLHRLPSRLLDRNRSFLFLELTRKQWEEFDRRRSARTATWSETSLPRARSIG